VGETKYFTTGLEQARSANEDDFAAGITFAIADQKHVRNVKMTIKGSDTALLFINWLNHSPSPFSMCSSTASFHWLTAVYHELHFLWLLLSVLNNNLRTTAIHYFIARKPVLTESWLCC